MVTNQNNSVSFCWETAYYLTDSHGTDILAQDGILSPPVDRVYLVHDRCLGTY